MERIVNQLRREQKAKESDQQEDYETRVGYEK